MIHLKPASLKTAVALAGLFALFAPASFAANAQQSVELLQEHSIQSTPEGLAEYFDSLELNENSRSRISSLLKQLGDEDFFKREAAMYDLVKMPILAPDLIQAAVDGSDPEGYVADVSEMLTTKQKAKFTQEFAEFQKLGIEPGLKGTGTILASGLADMDDDSATVLVAHDSAVQAKEGTTQRHYRWSVTLRKVGDTWLVDDFTPVS